MNDQRKTAYVSGLAKDIECKKDIASLINFMSASSFVAANIVNFNDSFFTLSNTIPFRSSGANTANHRNLPLRTLIWIMWKSNSEMCHSVIPTVLLLC